MFESRKSATDKAVDGSARDGQRTDGGSGRTEFGAPRPAGGTGREGAVIGPSIHIDGDVRGEEDLLIEGEVSGTVQLKNNSLTIGPQGKVSADVYAHSVYVDGYVDGDLYGSERVSIRKGAQVKGNVTSPRVSLEDGAKFKGSIEMDPQAVQASVGAGRSAVKAGPAAATGTTKPTAKFGDGAVPKPDMPAAAVVKSGAAN